MSLTSTIWIHDEIENVFQFIKNSQFESQSTNKCKSIKLKNSKNIYITKLISNYSPKVISYFAKSKHYNIEFQYYLFKESGETRVDFHARLINKTTWSKLESFFINEINQEDIDEQLLDLKYSIESNKNIRLSMFA